jgi:Family of unknown function (DUF5989)
MSNEPLSEFEQATQEPASNNLLTDFAYFLRTSKKWWLVPLLIMIVLLGGLMLLSGTAAAPFIYTLF